MDVSSTDTPTETLVETIESITETITASASSPLKASLVIAALFAAGAGLVTLIKRFQRWRVPQLKEPAPEEPLLYDGVIGGGPI